MTMYYSDADLKYLEERMAESKAKIIAAAFEHAEPEISKRVGKIADDSASIAQRLKEIEAEKMAAIMGKPLEPTEAPKDIDWTGYGYPTVTFNLPDLRGRVKASG